MGDLAGGSPDIRRADRPGAAGCYAHSDGRDHGRRRGHGDIRADHPRRAAGLGLTHARRDRGHRRCRPTGRIAVGHRRPRRAIAARSAGSQ